MQAKTPVGVTPEHMKWRAEVSLTCGEILHNACPRCVEHNLRSITDVEQIIPGVKPTVTMNIFQLQVLENTNIKS